MGANPKQQYGDKKVPLHLVPAALDVAAAWGLGEGAIKYGPFNWRENSVEVMTYVAAIKRHLAAWVDGEELDPDSITGKHHLDGLAASLAILLDAVRGGFAIDNRPPCGPGPELVRVQKTQQEQLVEKRVADGAFDVIEQWQLPCPIDDARHQVVIQ